MVPRQILVYRSVLSPVSPLYYKGVGKSPYPYNVEYIITQIGRENINSADFYVCIKDRRGRRSLQIVIFLIRRSIKQVLFSKFRGHLCRFFPLLTAGGEVVYDLSAAECLMRRRANVQSEKKYIFLCVCVIVGLILIVLVPGKNVAPVENAVVNPANGDVA